MSRPSPQIRKARVLRRWMTEPQDLLWQALRNRQLFDLKFRRKAPVGPLVVDFLCPAASLVVEITGVAQHVSRMQHRDAALLAAGFGVVRLTPEQVRTRMPEVLSKIGAVARARL